MEVTYQTTYNLLDLQIQDIGILLDALEQYAPKTTLVDNTERIERILDQLKDAIR